MSEDEAANSDYCDADGANDQTVEHEANKSDTHDISDDDVIIIEAVKAIVRATNTAQEATLAMKLLEKELRKSLKEVITIDDDDENEGDNGDQSSELEYPDSDEGDDERINTLMKEGRLVPQKHKKGEGEKWQEFMV
jgi:hypothetical protein